MATIKTKAELAELRLIATSILSGILSADPIRDYRIQRYADAIEFAKEFQDKLNQEFGPLG